ncbi:MAG TPA: DUF5985 family protein [Bryobacteraceae bacterium]|nr:DUF5985 family protein [Bryobacteraceae bacterium]
MSPDWMVRLEMFLLGALSTLCVIAALHFFKFWRKTRDALFLAFAASFLVRSLNDFGRASSAHPNEGTLFSYFVSLAASLLIVLAIVLKNFSRKG